MKCVVRLLFLVFVVQTFLLAPDGLLKAADPRAGLARFGIQLELLPVNSEFGDAISSTALNFACGRDILTLERGFRHFGLTFDAGLVRVSTDQVCHIWYEPSIRGFRADPDDYSISELYFDVNTLSYFSFRESVIGDSLDIARQVAQQIPNSLKVTIGISGEQGRDWRAEATEFHFPKSIHELRLHVKPSDAGANPWAQDYLKSGRVGSQKKILVPRNLFEGTREAGARFHSFLDSFDRSEMIRSNLSWEGGDLIFVVHPRNPDKIILVHGDSAKAYWGNGLTEEEYAYVLKEEFGADYLVDMSGLEAHVDYAAAFLPRQKLALVSRPVRGNFEIARSAWEYLRESYPHVAAPEFVQIDQFFTEGRPAVIENSEAINALLLNIRSRDLPWSARDNQEIASLTSAYIQKNCPAGLETCLAVDRANRALRRNIGFMNEWVTASYVDWTDHRLPDRLLALISSQLPSNATPSPERLEEKAKELERLGFKVVRVPKLAGTGELGVPWTGISYVNSLYVDPFLFVPTFGLGTAEIELIEDLQKDLPRSVRIVPVYAQHMLLYNGGVHCVTGIVRTPGKLDKKGKPSALPAKVMAD